MRIRDAQRLIEQIYGRRDGERGLAATYVWFLEEVGELTKAIRKKSIDQVREEVADVLAWFLTSASLVGVDVEDAFLEKYGRGCPACGRIPCACPLRASRFEGRPPEE